MCIVISKYSVLSVDMGRLLLDSDVAVSDFRTEIFDLVGGEAVDPAVRVYLTDVDAWMSSGSSDWGSGQFDLGVGWCCLAELRSICGRYP